MSPKLESASLRAKDGSVTSAEVPAFPDNPELVKTPDGRYFVADSPAIGYGQTVLGYHEVSVYEAS